MAEPKTADEILSAIDADIASGRIVVGELLGTCRIIARYCLANSGITLSASDALMLVRAALSKSTDHS